MKQLKRDYVGVAPIKTGGRLETDPEQKANLLNNQFKSVFVQEDQSGPVPGLEGTGYSTINDLQVTTKGVEKLLLNLVTHKASGPDQIPNIFLKTTVEQTAPILRALFGQSLASGEFPLD